MDHLGTFYITQCHEIVDDRVQIEIFEKTFQTASASVEGCPGCILRGETVQLFTIVAMVIPVNC